MPSTAPVTPPATARPPTAPAGCSEQILKLIAADYELARRNIAQSHDVAVHDLEDQFSGGMDDEGAYQKALANLDAEKQSLLEKLDINKNLAETQCDPDVVLKGL